MSKQKPKSKYGLPKNSVVSAYSKELSEEARKWVDLRDALEARLMDVQDAYEAEIIDRRTYASERAPLILQLREALRQYDVALRARGPATKPKGVSRSKRAS